jgi:hypothetical protein
MPVRHAWNVLRHCFPSGIAIVVPLLLCLAVVPSAQADSSTPVTATVTAYYNGDYFCPGGAGNCPGGLYPACDGGNSSGPYGQLIANLDAGDTFAGTDSVSAGDSRQIGSVGPYYSSSPADPDPAVCVLGTAG